jgi:hypothetical protein
MQREGSSSRNDQTNPKDKTSSTLGLVLERGPGGTIYRDEGGDFLRAWMAKLGGCPRTSLMNLSREIINKRVPKKERGEPRICELLG